MIEILPAPDHVFAVKIAGTLTSEDYDRMISEIEAKLARHPRISVYADMSEFKDLTAGAAAKDIRYVLGKIGEWGRFKREAVITDKQWLRVLIKTLDPLVPQVEVRAFALSERDAALDWVAAL
jgi:hypothetical protein